MFARVVTATVDKAEAFDNTIALSRTQLPTFEKMPGFQGFHLLVDRDSGKLVTLSLWDTTENMAGAEAAGAAVTHRSAASLGIELPHRETYEVAISTGKSDGPIRQTGEHAPEASMFSVYGHLTALPGRREEVIALFKEGARAGGDDSGLLTFSINTALDDPDTMWVTQLWTDKEAHDATTRSEPVATVTQRLLALLVQQPAGSHGHAVYVQGRTPE